MNAYRKAATLRARKDPALIAHGTGTAYNYYGCRCDLCREARMAYQRNYRKAAAS